jgi:hypothetical protein
LAVELTERAGGTVRRDETLPGRPVVFAFIMQADDEVIAALARLRCLREVWCQGLEPRRVRDLCRLPNLREVCISDSEVEAKDLRALASLTHLRTLQLYSCPNVSDAVAAMVKGCAAIEALDFEGCGKVTGVGLGELQPLP